MKKQFKLGVIGGGFMAYAIIKGAVHSGFIVPDRIFVGDCNAENLGRFKELGCDTTMRNAAVAEKSEFLLFSIKPQTFPAVARELTQISIPKAISIMAGVEKSTIKAALPKIERVCRVMPNLPCSIGSGMIAADPSDFENASDLAFFSGLFGSLGEYLTLPESKMHAVTGISGSGPAYVFLFLKALIEAGKKQGLSEEEAAILSTQTILGGVNMYLNEKDNADLDTLIARVCSKGGTTEKAMESLKKNNLTDIIDQAVIACVEQSKELAK